MKTLIILFTCIILFSAANGQPKASVENENKLASQGIVYSPNLDTIRVSLVIGRSGKFLEDIMGYDVREYMARRDTPLLSGTVHIKYLDYRKHILPKGITVWMAKDIR